MKKNQQDKKHPKMIKMLLRSLGLVIFLIGILSAAERIPQTSGQEDDVVSLLDRLAERIGSYRQMEHWTASVRSEIVEMNKRWEPKKTTLILKNITTRGEVRTEEILEALETKKGRTRDVTVEIRKETRKQEEKARKRREKGKAEGNRRRRELTRDQISPFGYEMRKNLQFTIKEMSEFAGSPVYILESSSDKKDEDLYTGTYYVDRESLDVLRVELSPTKKPAVLKTVAMAFDFQVLPEGYLALRKSWFKMHLNVVVKVVRLEAIEEYTNVRPLNGSQS